MTKTGIAKSLLSVVFACGCALSMAQEPGAAETMAPFLNGGVGEEERAMIADNAKDYSLKLMFAEKTGAYMADVDVVITDAKAREVLTLEDVGPFLLVKLPAGRYRIKAMAQGKTQQQSFTVGGKGLTQVTLRW